MSVRWKIAQFFEERWWRNYLNDKDDTTYLAWKKAYWLGFLDTLKDCVNPLPHQRFLDAGCGPAGIFMVLPGKVTAIDPLLEFYQTKLSIFHPNQYPNVEFVTTRAEDFVAEQSFDMVFSMNVINHVTDISQSIQALHRACKKDGLLVMSVDAHNYGILRTLFRWFQADILHPHQYTLTEYIQLLEQNGFGLVKEVLMKKGFIFNYVVLVATPSHKGVK